MAENDGKAQQIADRKTQLNSFTVPCNAVQITISARDATNAVTMATGRPYRLPTYISYVGIVKGSTLSKLRLSECNMTKAKADFLYSSVEELAASR